MSNQSPFAGRTAQAFPTLPRGDVLGTYDSYPDAQRVVAKLAEADFPVAKIAIVGNDLKTVERVTGKMTYGRAAIAGALSGLWLGIFFGIVLTLFSPSAGGLILAAAIIGAAFGMLYGIVSFAITKRQRDFTSVHQVLATNYQIVVDPQLTGQAQRILGQHGATPSTHWNDAPQPGAPGTQSRPFQGQQPWHPGPQQGSPYGGHATPHQPGGPQRPGTSAPAPQADGSGPGVGPRGTGPDRGRSGTDDGPRYGTNDGPRYGTNDGPRYGTNDGPRYGETPQAAQQPAPTTDPRLPQARPDAPPQYGERVTGSDDHGRDGGGQPGSDGQDGTGHREHDGDRPGSSAEPRRDDDRA
ncbi:general stress protein [Curtobacterium caseinilyticum]|uniref:ECF transporter S component n=1 Tax=Curtobacterium caseinilyticum TaxID=3055137 RepID=A0ABT7TNE0_9MICO|nr:general stress protein [Curtobacterium caseinilyticum]MDM7891096.1 ECF transporter S component [Curtobacterium caseinilyticum]